MTRTTSIVAGVLLVLTSIAVRAQDPPFTLAGEDAVGGSCPGIVTVKLRNPGNAKAGAAIFLSKETLGMLHAQDKVPRYDPATGNAFEASFAVSDPQWCGLQVAVRYQNQKSDLSEGKLIFLPGDPASIPTVSLITREVPCGIPTSVYFSVKGDLSSEAVVEIGGKTATMTGPNLATVHLQYPCGKETQLQVSCIRCSLGDPRQLMILDSRRYVAAQQEVPNQRSSPALFFAISSLVGLGILTWWTIKQFAILRPKADSKSGISQMGRSSQQTSGQSDPTLTHDRRRQQSGPPLGMSERRVTSSQLPAVVRAVPASTAPRQAQPFTEAAQASAASPFKSEGRTGTAAPSYQSRLSPWQRLVYDYNRALENDQSRRDFERDYAPTRIAISNLEDVTSRNHAPVFTSNERGDLFLIAIEPDFYLVPTFDHPWQGDFVRNWTHSFVIDPGPKQRLGQPAEATNQTGPWTVKQKGRLTRGS